MISRTKLRWVLLGAMLVGVAAASVWAVWPRDRRPPRASAGKGVSSPELVDRWGINDLRVVRTAAGHLLDFRYHVVDAVKAAAVQKREARPYLVDLKSGRRLAVPTTPKAGALWNHGQVKPGRTYFALFSNPGRAVQRGDRVSVVIDKFMASDLLVE
jgi:hypothetical protein